MGRRYYCDYCDKSFIDDLDARKKHLISVAHQQARNQHYQYFRNPNEILEEETKKSECRKFFQGTCTFGVNCRYSHYTQYELQELKRQVEENKRLKIQNEIKKSVEANEVPSIESWLEKRNQKLLESSKNKVQVFWTYPEFLDNRPDLPPSLIKFKPEHFKDADFAEWG